MLDDVLRAACAGIGMGLGSLAVQAWRALKKSSPDPHAGSEPDARIEDVRALPWHRRDGSQGSGKRLRTDAGNARKQLGYFGE